MTAIEIFFVVFPLACSYIECLVISGFIIAKKGKTRFNYLCIILCYLPSYIVWVLSLIFLSNNIDTIVLPFKIIFPFVPIVYASVNYYFKKKKYYVCDTQGNVFEDKTDKDDGQNTQ